MKGREFSWNCFPVALGINNSQVVCQSKNSPENKRWKCSFKSKNKSTLNLVQMSFHLQLMLVKSTFLGRNRKRKEGATWEDEDRIRRDVYLLTTKEISICSLFKEKEKPEEMYLKFGDRSKQNISRQMTREKHQSLVILLFWRDTRLTLSLSFYSPFTTEQFCPPGIPWDTWNFALHHFSLANKYRGREGGSEGGGDGKHILVVLSPTNILCESLWDIYSLSSPTSVSLRTTSCCP